MTRFFLCLKNDIKNCLLKNKNLIAWLVFFELVAIIIGIYLAISSSVGISILKDGDKNLFNFIIGDGNLLSLFWAKTLEMLVLLGLIFILSLNYYLSFFAPLILIYQACLFGVTCVNIVNLYGVFGGFCLIFIILPFNFVLFFILNVFFTSCFSRVSIARKFNLNFINSINYGNCLKIISLMVFLYLILIIGFVFVLALFLKSYVFAIF